MSEKENVKKIKTIIESQISNLDFRDLVGSSRFISKLSSLYEHINFYIGFIEKNELVKEQAEKDAYKLKGEADRRNKEEGYIFDMNKLSFDFYLRWHVLSRDAMKKAGRHYYLLQRVKQLKNKNIMLKNFIESFARMYDEQAEQSNKANQKVDYEKVAESMHSEECSDIYSDSNFWDKINKFAKKAGVKLVYLALLLYYVLENGNTPAKVKAEIIGALGYLILPIDLIPDVIPVVGLTDDLGALMIVYNLVKCHITPEVRKNAKAKCAEWFGNFDAESLEKSYNE